MERLATAPVRVLLIEDNPDHAFIERAALERELHASVTTASEPESGLDRLREDSYDIVLLDYHLPGYDGLDVLRRIKEGRADLPVILITAVGNEEVAVEAMKQGASDYLVKRFGDREDAKLAETVRRSLEQAELGRNYRRSQELLRKTVNLAYDGIAHVNLHTGLIESANPSLARMAGVTQGELAGRPWADLFEGEEREQVARLQELAQNQTEIEARFRTGDGSIALVELRAVEVEIEGEPNALVTIRDVSEKRRLHEQLVQAQKMQAVGTLAGGIAHDFNNLLGAILGYSSYLKRHISREDRLFKSVETIESAAERAAELVRRLLSFSRRGPSERRVFSPNSVVEETERLVARSLPKSIQVTLDHEAEAPAVEGDETQIQQVLLNIIVNARDAMKEGGRLTIRTATAKAGDVPLTASGGRPQRPFVMIAVKDTGVGMPKEVRDRIFEPFFTTKGPGKGTGLGLATAYAIVKAHDGVLDVLSEPGQGTEIRVFLPASTKAPFARRLDTTPERAGSGTILVVDDEVVIRDLTTDILEERGYKVYLAPSGDEALKIFEQRKGEIDLVILDIIMPGMNGIEALRRLKQVDPGVRVLLSSGFSPEGTQEEGAAAGAVGFIAKPYRVADLSKTVREALAKPKQ